MHILHISNDFGGTEVYKNLYQSLDKIGIQQTILVPVNPRVKSRVGNHDFEFQTKGSSIVYSHVQQWYHRYLYESKISVAVRDAYKLIDINTIDIIHTGTLAMTGAIAYELNKKHNIPYIVSVRNTDINTYFKKMWWKKSYFNKILLNASSVIFISPQYKQDCFDSHFDKKVVQKIKTRSLVIPNGIDSYYLKNRKSDPKAMHMPIEIVFAAGFRGNKNLVRLIDAIDIIRSEEYDVELTAIGEGLPNRKVSDEYLEKIYSKVKNKPYIQLKKYMNKVELCEDYTKRDIFVMPSINETFGLSYAEALSQGLPIVYTKGQGFDGFYEDGVAGKSVNALSVDDIARGIKYVINNYETISDNVANLDLEEDFKWSNIAAKYRDLYTKTLSNKQ